MFRQRCTFVRSSLAVATVVFGMSLMGVRAFAQSSPKERLGKAHWENRYSWWPTRHARNYASDLYRYSAAPIRHSPQFMQAQSEECGRNLAASQKNLAAVKKTVKGDMELEQRVASIRRHLAKASEHYKKMHAECCKNAIDGKATMACCHDLISSLDSANAEFAALERRLLQRTASVRTPLSTTAK